jgi:hypothetical protein
MMKQTITITIALVLSCSALVHAADTKYSPEGAKFEIVFPDKPMENDLGKGQGKMQLLPADGGKAVYLFYHRLFPKEVDITNKEAVALIVKSGLDAGLENWKGTVKKEREFMVNKMFPAKEFEIDAPTVGVIKLQLILTKTEFYQVVVGGSKEFVDSEPAKKFIESFKLKD